MAKANIIFYHHMNDRSVSSLKCTLHYQTDDKPGFVRLSFSNKSEDGEDNGNTIDCELGFNEISQFVRFIGGEEECKEPLELKPEGTYLMVKNLKEKGFGIAAVYKDDAEELKSQIVLRPYEAEGLRLVLEQTLFFIAFIKGVNP